MDERRDLVDREELRRRLEENFSESNTHAWVGAHRSVLSHLDAMPAVEWTRGWTRDEVLAELDADPDAVCEVQNAFDGDWRPVERRIVAGWHPEVRRYDVRVVRVAPGPEWVPLTQLVGRTIDGCSGAVNRFHVDRYHAKWWALHDLEFQDRPFPEGTLNLETGQVAVRPKAIS
jgi:hypothetical protein